MPGNGVISGTALFMRRKDIIYKITVRCVEIKGPLNTPCMVWQGPCSGKGRGGGYPRMSLDGATVAVHRVMFTNHFGYIPPKKQVDHKCENRMCVNPYHLQLTTHRKNQGFKKGRQT